MMLENRITNSLENNVQNHVDMVSETSQSVTQSYVDKVRNSTSVQNSITQITRLRNVEISGDGRIEIRKKASISASLIAQNTITNKRTDRTNLATIMQSALQQAVESQAELDTSQKAVNIMEQLDQNNGGVEGVVAKMADTVTNVFGGGNTEQDIKNILESSIKQNTNNGLNMRNVIDTSIDKSFETNTFNECKSELTITQITELENVKVSGRGELLDIQEAALESATTCFNQVFNIADISTDVSAASGQTAAQSLSNIAQLKSKQDIDNKLKQTKLQKNFLDSMFGGSALIVIVIVVIIMALGKGGGGKGGSDKGGKGMAGMIGGIIFFFIFVFIIGVIVLLIIHKDAFKSKKKGGDNIIDSLNPAARFVFEKQSDNSIKIFNFDGSLQLIKQNSNIHASQTNIEDRPPNSMNLEFSTEMDNTSFTFEEVDIPQESQTPTSSASNQENEPHPKRFKIKTSDGQFQLGFLYSDNIRNNIDRIIVEPVLYRVSNMSNRHKEKFIFSMTPEFDIDNISSNGYLINHVNKQLDNDEDIADHDLENDMIGTLFASDKPLNGGEFRSIGSGTLKGVEFRFD